MLPPAAVLFDVGNTVLEERRFDLEAGILAAVPALAARVPELARSFRDELRERHAAHRELLLARWLLDHVPELAGESVDAVEDAVWSAVVTLVPTLGVAELLRRLRDDGVATAAVSNASFSGRVLRREMGRHALGDDFRFVLSSGDLGVRKPAPAIFREALGRLGVPAERCWFVGDTWAEDVVGAIGAGLTPIWLGAGAAEGRGESRARRVRDWTAFLEVYEASRSRTGAP
jgi:putative hydrolase of the HAD superfamily